MDTVNNTFKKKSPYDGFQRSSDSDGFRQNGQSKAEPELSYDKVQKAPLFLLQAHHFTYLSPVEKARGS